MDCCPPDSFKMFFDFFVTTSDQDSKISSSDLAVDRPRSLHGTCSLQTLRLPATRHGSRISFDMLKSLRIGLAFVAVQNLEPKKTLNPNNLNSKSLRIGSVFMHPVTST